MAEPALVRVLVVDDHEIVRRGVVEVVDADPLLTVVAEAGSVLDAVRRNLLDERALARRRATHADPTDTLTPTERKVLELIGAGLSNREIGERLGLAEKTVKNHVTGLLSKMGFRRRTQAAAWVAGHR